MRATETNAQLSAQLDEESRLAEMLVQRQGTFRQRAIIHSAIGQWRQHTLAASPEKAAAPPPAEKENGLPYTTPLVQSRPLANSGGLSTGSAAETPTWNAGGWNAGCNPLATPTIGLMG